MQMSAKPQDVQTLNPGKIKGHTVVHRHIDISYLPLWKICMCAIVTFH